MTYRVTLPLDEVDTAEGGWVPHQLTTAYTATSRCMRESPEIPGRCIALEGNVGQHVRCAIYERRPSACRDFGVFAQLGIGDEACDEARRRRGLPPLKGL